MEGEEYADTSKVFLPGQFSSFFELRFPVLPNIPARTLAKAEQSLQGSALSLGAVSNPYFNPFEGLFLSPYAMAALSGPRAPKGEDEVTGSALPFLSILCAHSRIGSYRKFVFVHSTDRNVFLVGGLSANVDVPNWQGTRTINL